MMRALLCVLIGLTALPGCGGQTPVYQLDDFSTDPPRPGPLAGDIVVCDSGDDTLSVVDPAARERRWQVPVGFIPVEREGPHDVVAAPDGSEIFVTLSEAVAGSGVGPHGAHGTGTIPGYVLKLSTSDATLSASAVVEPNPAEMAIASDGATLYVTHYDVGKWVSAARAGDITKGYSDLAVIDTATLNVKKLVPLCPGPHGIDMSRDGATVYTTCGTDEIAVVDVSRPGLPVTRVPEIPGAGEGTDCIYCPYRLSVAPDGTVWVANLGLSGASGGGQVRVYDPAQGSFDVARTLNVCGQATAVEFLPTATGYQVYVVEQGLCGGAIDVFTAGEPGTAPANLATLRLPTSACISPNDMDISEEGPTGYVVCEGDHTGPGSLVVFDPVALTVSASVPVGVFPSEMAEVAAGPP